MLRKAGMMGIFEKSVGVWRERKEEGRTTKEDMEDACGEGEQECWFGEKGCHVSSEMERGSLKDCGQSGVNAATPIYGDKPGSKLDWLMI